MLQESDVIKEAGVEVSAEALPDEQSETSDCYSASSSSGGMDAADSSSNDALKKELAARETKTVFWSRVLAFVCLLIAALVVSLIVYFLAKEAEMEEFETHYDGSSAKVLQAFQGIVDQKLLAVGSIEVAAIAEGQYHDKSWPLMTLPAFQERAATARSLSGSLFLSINPIVNETNRLEWEQFVEEEGSDWM